MNRMVNQGSYPLMSREKLEYMNILKTAFPTRKNSRCKLIGNREIPQP
jgi:hypothetical protein